MRNRQNSQQEMQYQKQYNSNEEYESDQQDNDQQQNGEYQLQQGEKYTKQNDYHEHKFNTFQPQKKETRIDYSKGIAQYLNKVDQRINSNQTPTNSQLKQSRASSQKQDMAIQLIINQVLNKRRKQSRISNTSNSNNLGTQMGHKYHFSNTETQIDLVNERLKKQNEELAKNIKKLGNKIKQFNHIPYNTSASTTKLKNSSNTNRSLVSTPNTSVVASNLIQQKLKQLQKLKGRLQKAEKANSRMQLQLSKLQLSRKSNKSRLKLTSQRNKGKQDKELYEINIKCSTCNNCAVPSKTVSRRPTQQQANSNSPLKKDYYSPIMQFQQYSLNNEPTISMYDGTMQRTSQFGINLIQSQPNQEIEVADKETQAAIGLMECLKQEADLDQQIAKLEQTIKKNNAQISKYESMLMKQVM